MKSIRPDGIGVECNPARNAAFIEPASQVRAAVIADMLGLHPNSATRWVELAGAKWTNYAAERPAASKSRVAPAQGARS